MFYTQPDGVKTHYDMWDIDAERDVFFLHGNLASNRWWLPLLSYWPSQAKPGRDVAKDGRAIAVEWRGCGFSDAPQNVEQLHPKFLAADVLRLIETVSEASAPVDIVGHSTGGLIAVFVALLKPEKINKLVLIDAVGPQGVQFEPDFLKIFDVMKADRSVCKQVLMSTIYDIDTSGAYFSSLVDDAMRMADLNWRGVLNQLVDIDVVNEIKGLERPVFILQGQHDEVCPMAGAEAYRDALPFSQFNILSGRGHCPLVEDAALVADLISQFVRETSAFKR